MAGNDAGYADTVSHIALSAMRAICNGASPVRAQGNAAKARKLKRDRSLAAATPQEQFAFVVDFINLHAKSLQMSYMSMERVVRGAMEIGNAITAEHPENLAIVQAMLLDKIRPPQRSGEKTPKQQRAFNKLFLIQGTRS